MIGFHISIIKYMCACSPRDRNSLLQTVLATADDAIIFNGSLSQGGVLLQVTKARYLVSVKTENNGVSVSRQCFSYKCHVSNIDFHK